MSAITWSSTHLFFVARRFCQPREPSSGQVRPLRLCTQGFCGRVVYKTCFGRQAGALRASMTCARGAGTHGNVLNVHTATFFNGHTGFSGCHTTHTTPHTIHHTHHNTRHNTTTTPHGDRERQRQRETETETETVRDRKKKGTEREEKTAEERQEKTYEDKTRQDRRRRDKTSMKEKREDKTQDKRREKREERR